MLTATELASMRSTMGDSLAGTAVVQTSAFVSDGGGGGTTTWTASGTVDCRVAPATSSNEKQIGDRLQPETETIFTIPQTTTIDSDARITYEGRVYTVTALRAPRTWEISRRVEAREVE
jgi:SPP1 family predicted phage head-tail adaptor